MNGFSKKRKMLCIILLAFLAAATLTACAEGDGGGDGHIDLSDPLGGSAIMTAEELKAFAENGEGNTAVLANNIDLESEMLVLNAQRGDFTIEGNGFTVTGIGDCVIRLDKGLRLTLNNVTIVGGSDGIGALGDCTVSGSNSTIKGVASAVNCIGFLTIGDSSSLVFEAQEGNGAVARAVTIGKGATLSASGGLSGVISLDGDITLMPSSELLAKTKVNYNALQCARTLAMTDGSVLAVQNDGLYHGAETDSLSIEGAATINAAGGSKGTGLFIYTLDEELRVLGTCSPEARFENGSGGITFVESKEELATPEP